MLKKIQMANPNIHPWIHPMHINRRPSDPVPYEELTSFLRHFSDEHKIILTELEKFESALLEIRKEGINKGLNQNAGRVFSNSLMKDCTSSSERRTDLISAAS